MDEERVFDLKVTRECELLSSALPLPVADVLVPPSHDDLPLAPDQLAPLLEPPHAEDRPAQVRRVVEDFPPGHDATRINCDL